MSQSVSLRLILSGGGAPVPWPQVKALHRKPVRWIRGYENTADGGRLTYHAGARLTSRVAHWLGGMTGWRDGGMLVSYEIIKIYFAKVLPRGERGGIVEYGTGGGEKLDLGFDI